MKVGSPSQRRWKLKTFLAFLKAWEQNVCLLHFSLDPGCVLSRCDLTPVDRAELDALGVKPAAAGAPADVPVRLTAVLRAPSSAR
jgi:hypothetical protein